MSNEVKKGHFSAKPGWFLPCYQPNQNLSADSLQSVPYHFQRPERLKHELKTWEA